MLEMGHKSEIQCRKGHFNLLTGSLFFFLDISQHLVAAELLNVNQTIIS